MIEEKINEFKEKIYKEYDKILEEIQAQYINTNIKELLKGIIEIKKKYFLNAYFSLIKHNLSLSTAKGDSLDLWGVLLGTNRYIPGEPVGKDYNYFSFNDKTFFQLIFNNPNKPEYSALNDESFREMLLFLLQKFYIKPSIKDVNKFLDNFFQKYGGINIRDSKNMDFVVYYFNKNIPSWLDWFLKNGDILPRPAGVGSNFDIVDWGYFGFETEDEEYNIKNVRNFNNGNFAPFEVKKQ